MTLPSSSDTIQPFLRAPFPWFGGKTRVAHLVARALGIDAEPAHIYVEPFAGGLAVLLSLPIAARLEIVSDAYGLVANFWRALRYQPDEVARHADRAFVELDIKAAWAYLRDVDLAPGLVDIRAPGDAFAAGLWAWAVSNTMGSNTRWAVMHVATAGQGLAASGFGTVHEGLQKLAARMARVRILHGDWKRAIKRASGKKQDAVTRAFFLDPPYRNFAPLYNTPEIDHDYLQDWALQTGINPKTRIVVCGHEGDYELPGWSTLVWDRGSNMNRGTAQIECLWMSPACLPIESPQLSLL